MADKKYNQRNVRPANFSKCVGGVKKIIYPVSAMSGTKNGTSHSVSIPIEFLKKLGWKERQKVVVKKIRGGIQIKDWKK